jgi:class 3 adenylate cyclase
MNTPHVVAQVPLRPREARELACRFEVGAYRARSPHATSPTTFDVLDGGTSTALELRVTADGVIGGAASLGPGDVRLGVRNDTPHRTSLAVEGYRWPDTVATAAVVSTLPQFRDLFASEVLAPGLQLGIRRMAFMFTDLTGSTALYQAVGQARAFRIVQDQFAILAAAIEDGRGAIVKTIGDAVMATFETGADGLAAALAIQRDIRRLQVDGAADPARLVRVGLHQGACVAVTLNERLDYFGTTVNVAARVEHEARGGEIVATSEVYDADDARAVLDESGATVSPDVVRLRGISEPVRIVRIRAR